MNGVKVSSVAATGPSRSIHFTAPFQRGVHPSFIIAYKPFNGAFNGGIWLHKMPFYGIL